MDLMSVSGDVHITEMLDDRPVDVWEKGDAPPGPHWATVELYDHVIERGRPGGPWRAACGLEIDGEMVPAPEPVRGGSERCDDCDGRLAIEVN